MSGCGGAMRTISDLLARQGVASASFPSAASAKFLPGGAVGRSELTFADIGARIGEDDEKLRNLLIDTDRRMGALDDLKEAFRNLVEPIGSSLRALEEKKTENFGLRNALTELRSSHESLRIEYGLLEKCAAELETAGEDLRRFFFQAEDGI